MKTNRRKFIHAAAATLALSSLPRATHAASAAPGTVKIGIVGSGRVGGTLGRLWANAGHAVMFSSLDLDHDKALAASVGANASAGTPRQAAAFGDVLLISVPYHALPSVGKDLAGLLKGKVVIDTCNPFAERDGEVGVWAQKKGAGLASAELLPGAASSAPSTRSATQGCQKLPGASRAPACRWRAKTRRRSRSCRAWCVISATSLL